MRIRTTLILLGILIVLLGVLFYVNLKSGGVTATPAATGPASLLDVTSPAITGITVRDTLSNTTASATRDTSGAWWLTAPADKPANPETLNTLAANLANIYVQRIVTPTGGLGEFGLLTPTLEVEVAATSGPLSFAVGDMTPSRGAYYAQKSGDARVYLINTSVVDDSRQFANNPPIAVPPTATFAPSSVPTPAPASP